MYKRKLSCIVIFWTLLILVHRNVDAGPMKRLSRMVREVYPEIDPENDGNQAQVCIVGDLVYGSEEPVPAEQPCLKCKCQPPGVQCETIQCVKKPGCRAIYKSNKCCPDYQCECEHNGKFYANGEKLETPPGGECKVCYCRGGEVQCAEVSCYIRKDCEGKRVPGQCCPKYDHCPPIDPMPGRPPYSTDITLSNLDKESFAPWPIIGISSNATENILTPTSNDIQDENKIPDTSDYEITTASYKATEVDDLQRDVGFLPRITIQEIIPERKEIPITAPPRIQVEPHGTLLIEEAGEFLNHSNELVATDSDTDSSEISEVFQHPPPVLKIGDTLLFLNKGEFIPEKDSSTPNSVITIIGAEGLQRGFEDSAEVHEVKIENISEESKQSKNTSVALEEQIANDNLQVKDNRDLNNEDAELNTASSTHILSLLKSKKVSEGATTEGSSPSTVSTSTTEAQILSSTTEINVLPETSTINLTAVQESVNETTLNNTESSDAVGTTLEILDNITSEEAKNITGTIPAIEAEPENTTETKEVSLTQSTIKHDDLILEHNPAYPPLPDIMSPDTDDTSQRFDVDNTEKDHAGDNITILPNFKILPEVLDIRSNKTVPQNITNSEWLKQNADTLINYEAVLPDDLLNEPAPSDIEDITEVENDVNTATPDIATFEAITVTDVSESETFTTDSSVVTTEEDNENKEVVLTTTDFPEDTARSVETMEDMREDSGELTTPKNSHASLTSNENASIEEKRLDSSEADDMVSVRHEANEHSGEETTPSKFNNSEMIDKEWTNNSNITNNKNSKDVEVIDTSTLQKKKTVIERTVDTATEELLPVPGKITLPSKIISKREISPEEEDREIFKQLQKELEDELAEKALTSDEEKKEAEVVFKELLEDTSTPKIKTSEPRKEGEGFERIFSSLTQQFSASKKADPGILGSIINLFSPQRYRKK